MTTHHKLTLPALALPHPDGSSGMDEEVVNEAIRRHLAALRGLARFDLDRDSCLHLPDAYGDWIRAADLRTLIETLDLSGPLDAAVKDDPPRCFHGLLDHEPCRPEGKQYGPGWLL